MDVLGFIKFMPVICTNIIFAYKSEKMSFSESLETDVANTNILNTLINVSIQTCIERCKASVSCHFINYRRKYHLCTLFGPVAIEYVDTAVAPGQVSSFKSDWDMTGYTACDSCPVKHSCKNNSTSCYADACGSPPYVQSSTTRGNMFSVGDHVLYRCDNTSDKYISECQSDGDWNIVGIQCNITDTNVLSGKTGSVWMYCTDSWYMFVRQELTWNDAKINCEVMASELVKVDQSFRDVCIQDIFNNLYPGESVKLWIGANDIDSEGIFQWTDGTLLTGYESWNKRQPDDALGKEDCVTVGTRQFKWNDNDCSGTHGSICFKLY